MRHFITLLDYTSEEISQILERSASIKRRFLAGDRPPLLAGRAMALLFEKPSLRTRVSFAAGMTHLGGSSEYLGAEAGWGDRESIADFSRVLSELVDVIVCRAKRHERVEQLAEFASCPVINGLTDRSHPCQALADLFTLAEHRGELRGAKLAYVGDANNVAASLAAACAKLGVRMALASPEGFTFDEAFRARLRAAAPNFELEETRDPREAVADADAVYTDVWTSMGQESEQAARAKAFAPYQVNEALMSAAPKRSIFLHCLPAKRGQEVTDGVIDGPNSAIVAQAGNRLHAQKGLLVWLLADGNAAGGA